MNSSKNDEKQELNKDDEKEGKFNIISSMIQFQCERERLEEKMFTKF